MRPRVSSRLNWTFSARNRASPLADVEGEERRPPSLGRLERRDQACGVARPARGRARRVPVGSVGWKYPDHDSITEKRSRWCSPRIAAPYPPAETPTIARPVARAHRAEMRVDVARRAPSRRTSPSSGPTPQFRYSGSVSLSRAPCGIDEDRRACLLERVDSHSFPRTSSSRPAGRAGSRRPGSGSCRPGSRRAGRRARASGRPARPSGSSPSALFRLGSSVAAPGAVAAPGNVRRRPPGPASVSSARPPDRERNRGS